MSNDNVDKAFAAFCFVYLSFLGNYFSHKI